jgi:signal transduction histidine kinase
MKFLKLKIIVSVYICLIGLAVYNTFHVYQVNRQSGKNKVFAKLEAVANLASLQIDGNQHKKIVEKYLAKDDIKETIQDKNYQSIHNQLNKIQLASKIGTPIYTLIKKSSNTLAFGVTSSQQPYYLHPYHTPPPILLEKFNVGSSLDEYEDENGIWLSAFSPIKTSTGEVVGIVQVDKNFNEFLNEINQELIRNIFFIVFIYSIIGMFLFVFLKDVLKQEENYNKTELDYKMQLENEVKIRTKELMVSNDQLKKVNMELESFFYSASHDIRGPISRILGLSYLAKIDENYGEILDKIEIESHKMDQMLIKMVVVNNLRTCEIKIETIKTKDIIDDVLFSVKDNYNDKQVHLKIDCNNSVDFFNTDQVMLKAILTSAIDNSFKFSDLNKPKVFIKASINQDQILHIAIGNNGKTFSDIEKQNAFDIFKRAHKLGDTDTIRLGLYTIKTCIDKLNGIVEINNQDGLTYLNILIPDANLTQKITQDLLQIPIS